MAGVLVVDTSVLIAMERGTLPADALRQVLPGARLVASSISVSELLHGYHRARTKSQRAARERFIASVLAELEIVSFDLRLAREHAALWAGLAEHGQVIGPYDLMIAATALAYRVPLATLNDREFSKIEGLEVLSLRPFLRE
ncbi:MAG: PIN domain-containing protein [Terriglobia bacterium]|jgi:predicted nucleic acid-binding protein